jgi:hypothetical protein
MRLFLLGILLILSFSKASIAKDNDSRLILGLGAEQCKVFLELPLTETLKNSLFSWVSAYLSAFNEVAYWTRKNGSDPSAQQLDLSFVTKDYVVREVNIFCKNNPKLNVVEVASTEMIINLPRLK